MKNAKQWWFVGWVAYGLACTAPTTASIITHTQTLDETVLAAAPPDVSGQSLPITVTFPRLDPGAGTLSHILFEYRFDCRIEADVTVGGGASGGFSGTFYADGHAFWSGGGGNDIGGPGPGTLTVSYPVAGSAPLLTSSSHPPAYSTFVGVGDMTLLANLTDITLDAGGDASARLYLLDTSYLRVTYDYTPVPEPASLGVLCLAGVVLCRRAGR